MIGVYKTTMAPADAFNFYATNPNLTVSNKATASAGGVFAGSLDFSGTYSGKVTVTNVATEGTLIVIHLTS